MAMNTYCILVERYAHNRFYISAKSAAEAGSAAERLLDEGEERYFCGSKFEGCDADKIVDISLEPAPSLDEFENARDNFEMLARTRGRLPTHQ